ncbi:hypothetical protein C8J57DRAFT_1463144 [Mycena rebaudengoi]|nr:hypothetical protein C8J57DRAFT_1463144 [Mycena rebaudengoi]
MDQLTLSANVEHDTSWYYPTEIAHDLDGVDLPDELKSEILATAWEYTRCVIPHYTNWARYIAWTRIVVMGIVAEFKGALVDVLAGDRILNYSLSGTLALLFAGTVTHTAMAREFRTFLLVTADKSSARRSSTLFRRYATALVHSPREWFRMRDCDGLARFAIAAALACNDLDSAWFDDAQLRVLGELGITLYDAVAFYKHRSEGEINSTFAYMPEEVRVKAFRQCREVLWALDAASASAKEKNPKMLHTITFLRMFGGPIHMMMRRYRFIDDGLTIGTPETAHVVSQTRANFKLWHRIDANGRYSEEKNLKSRVNGTVESPDAIADSQSSLGRYKEVLARRDELLFPNFAELLETAGDGTCGTCRYRALYGAESMNRFGGVELCEGCRAEWRAFLESFPQRAARAFPELVGVYGGVVDTVLAKL